IGTGIGRYALGRASEYANERTVWDVPIGRHQGVAHPLAIAKIELELARLMTLKAAWMHDHATDRVAAGEAANMAKYAAAEAGIRCLDTAIQTHGGNGMAREYGLAHLWGTVRFLRIAPVSREMGLNFVAQQSLGLPKSHYSFCPPAILRHQRGKRSGFDVVVLLTHDARDVGVACLSALSPRACVETRVHPLDDALERLQRLVRDRSPKWVHKAEYTHRRDDVDGLAHHAGMSRRISQALAREIARELPHTLGVLQR